MDHDEYADEAIFDDLYDDEPSTTGPKTITGAAAPPKAVSQAEQNSVPATNQHAEPNAESNFDADYTPAEPTQAIQSTGIDYSGYDNMNQDYSGYGNGDGGDMNQDSHNPMHSRGNGPFGDGQNMADMHGHGDSGSTAIKEDG